MPQREITQIKRTEIYSPEFTSAISDRNNNPEEPGSDNYYEVAAAILKWRPERVRLAISLLIGERNGMILPDWTEARLIDEDGREQIIFKRWGKR